MPWPLRAVVPGACASSRRPPRSGSRRCRPGRTRRRVGRPAVGPGAGGPADGAPSVSPGGDAAGAGRRRRRRRPGRAVPRAGAGRGRPGADRRRLHAHADAGHPELREHVGEPGDHGRADAVDRRTTGPRCNIAFVAQLGDIVDDRDERRAVAAGVAVHGDPRRRRRAEQRCCPATTTWTSPPGDCPLYNQYFPVSRYAMRRGTRRPRPTAATSARTSSAPTRSDRQNMDNYALFTRRRHGLPDPQPGVQPAGRRRSPGRSACWPPTRTGGRSSRRTATSTVLGRAQRAGDPHRRREQRRAAVAEARPPSCSIFLVVNGHFPTAMHGEARRTDTNACGEPVYSVLSPTTRTGRTAATAGCATTPSPRRPDQIPRSRTRRPERSSRRTRTARSPAYDMRRRPTCPWSVRRRPSRHGGVAADPRPDVPAGTDVDWYATVSDGTTRRAGRPGPSRPRRRPRRRWRRTRSLGRWPPGGARPTPAARGRSAAGRPGSPSPGGPGRTPFRPGRPSPPASPACPRPRPT